MVFLLISGVFSVGNQLNSNKCVGSVAFGGSAAGRPPLSSECGTYKAVKARFGPRVSTGRDPREQKMLKGHLPRVIYHRAYLEYEDDSL